MPLTITTKMKTLLAGVLAASVAVPAVAGTVALDPAALESRAAHGSGRVTPLALSAEGTPVVVLLDVAAGEVVPPHATETGQRLITVVSGTLSWGEGDTVEPASETAYPAGSFLLLPAGQMHWVAARDGAVRLQLVVLDDAVTVPGAAAGQ